MTKFKTKFQLLKKGLARHLMGVILLLVLVPSIVISGLSYKLASDDLYQKSVDALSSIALLQKYDILELVERVLLDLQVESERLSNVTLLSELIKAQKTSGLSLADFIVSYQWLEITGEYNEDIVKFSEIYDFYDVFLIDAKGNILYSVARESDLGTNLFNGQFSQSLFGLAAQKAFKSGQHTFSDFEPYEPSNFAMASFFVNIVLNEDGDKIGLIAFQAKQEKFNDIMRSHGIKDTIETYLLGGDLAVRSHSFAQSVAIKPTLNDDNVKQWAEENLMAENNEIEPLYFTSLNYAPVIGVFQTVVIADKQFIIVAEEEAAEVYAGSQRLAKFDLILLAITLFIAVLLVIRVTRGLVMPIIQVEHAVAQITSGNLKQSLDINAKFEIESLVTGLNAMLTTLRDNKQNSIREDWFQEGAAQLNNIIRGEQNVADLSRNIIRFICEYFNASVGAFYIVDDDNMIHLKGSYAFQQRKSFNNVFSIGEGMVGQAVLEQQPLIIHDLPQDYMVISSGLGYSAPKVLSVVPIIWNDSVRSVIELGSEKPLDKTQQDLLSTLSSAISIALNSSLSRDHSATLLKKTLYQSEQLKIREEELSSNNEMLKEQSSKLEKSAIEMEEKNHALQTQQEELRTSNEELEVKTEELERSGAVLEEKNADLDAAQIALEKRAEDLMLSSKYKSEFLANMSHELRTPLNSLLILAKLLADNKGENLTDKQIEYASTIHDSGADLLTLINDILDLSKIEAGRMEVNLEPVNLAAFLSDLKRKFKPLTDKKGISLEIINHLNDETIISDEHKLAQVIKNLMSNAIKFTSEGGVVLSVSNLAEKTQRQYALPKGNYLHITVKDTGIGLAESNLKSIFEAFQQADGTTSRKFGGTGLGLSISRELSKLLGGDIYVKSTLGEGSEFSLIVQKEPQISSQQEPSMAVETPTIQSLNNVNNEPVVKALEATHSVQALNQSNASVSEVSDDRHEIKAGDRCLLVIEDDAPFAEILRDVARDKGYKVLVANDGETGLYFTDYYKPLGIILDIGLPGIDGWEVIKRLKDNLATRHIPVHVMSGHDKTLEALKTGALSYLTKPIELKLLDDTISSIKAFIEQHERRLLVIEDNDIQRNSIIELIGEGDVIAESASSGEQALAKLKEHDFDCIILDLGLPDMEGEDLLARIKDDKSIKETPVIIYSGKELSRSETKMLEKYASSIIIKNVRSPEMLLDQTSLFLHRVEANMPAHSQKILHMMHDHESVLRDRNILVVDDDMRNIFALTTMLRDREMNVVTAKNGIAALQKLDEMASPDMVLMDIMMPEMDGYEAMQKIREQSQYKDLPIIALTAKAMKGDRAKCIDAGANDYLSKPIDTEKLLSMMRVWLYR